MWGKGPEYLPLRVVHVIHFSSEITFGIAPLLPTDSCLPPSDLDTHVKL
jgi:hypothetical protein